MIDPKTTITIADLASIVGIDRTTISRIQKEGFFVLKDRKVLLYEALRGLLSFYKNRSAGRNLQKQQIDADIATNKNRKMAAEARLAELKVAEAEGRLVSKPEIKAAWESLLLRLRSELLAIPERFSAQLDRESCILIDSEIRSALTALADQGKAYGK